MLVEILAQVKPFAVVSALQSVWFIYNKTLLERLLERRCIRRI